MLAERLSIATHLAEMEALQNLLIHSDQLLLNGDRG